MELINFRLTFGAGVPNYEKASYEFTRWYLKQAMIESGGNQLRAAELAGVHRNTLSRLMRTHGIDARTGRGKDWRRK
jgi:DNA-binding NtrC family response regulator